MPARPSLSMVLLSLLLAVPHAHAGLPGDDTGARSETSGAAVADDAEHAIGDPAAAPVANGARSGFGQVMAVLTGLLEDAAQREAAGGGEGFALDNPAIEISVTPVAGRNSFLQAPPERRTTRDERRATAEPLAGGTR